MDEQLALAKAKEGFLKHFNKPAEHSFLSYGRLEIIGNHTDHQHGHCLVAGCSLGIKAAVSVLDPNEVRIFSDGYGEFSFSIGDLAIKDNEKGTSIGLARGVLFSLKEKGFKIGGFSAYLLSDIFPGAGVSSSAAFELFVGEVINDLYNGGGIPRIALAEAGKYAENKYFGKASGLLDQCGSSFGRVQFLDFSDLDHPSVSPMPLPKWDLSIILVNPGASHAGLSDLYSQMPNDMKLVAREVFGKEVLGEVNRVGIREALTQSDVEPRAKKRALHFFGEDERVLRAKRAFETGNRAWFLELERETQLSQTHLLQNVMIPGEYEGSPLQAVDRANEVLVEGAARVMGGGLVGSIICFVPKEEKEAFLKHMIGFYGPEKVVEVSIPEKGAHEVK